MQKNLTRAEICWVVFAIVETLLVSEARNSGQNRFFRFARHVSAKDVGLERRLDERQPELPANHLSEQFFSQSMRIKLASPRAARLSIFFVLKSVVLHLLEGPELRTNYL